MLELPFLEVCTELFERKFKNRVLQRLDIPDKKCINVSMAELSNSLIGQHLKKVWREGLSLCFQFKNHVVLQLCLSKSTELLLTGLDEYIHGGLLDFYFNSGQILSVKDNQLPSKIYLNPVYSGVPDVLGKDMTVGYLKEVFSNNKEEVKYVLIDQNIMRGIEEVYADEILWYAGISPFSIAGKIPLDGIKILHKTMKYVLLDAIKQARKLDMLNFREATHDLLIIHHADKKKSPTGGEIKTKVLADLRTYWTDEQELYV
jgi:formamidopyrimidine-DNA glycosylase